MVCHEGPRFPTPCGLGGGIPSSRPTVRGLTYARAGLRGLPVGARAGRCQDYQTGYSQGKAKAFSELYDLGDHAPGCRREPCGALAVLVRCVASELDAEAQTAPKT